MLPQGGVLRFERYWGKCQGRRTRIPDFDRLVNSTRDNRRAIGRELYSLDRFRIVLGMRVLLLHRELQGSCNKHGGTYSLGLGEEYGGLRYLHPRL